MMAMCVGAPWPKEYYGESKVCGYEFKKGYDSFHEFILFDEMNRLGSGGL
jgi:hypothetical protein